MGLAGVALTLPKMPLSAGSNGIAGAEKQNFPNPYRDQTITPINLQQPSHVRLELWSLSGEKVAMVVEKEMDVGEYHIQVNPSALGLSNGNYIYQLEAKNSNGTFRLPKIM